MKSSFNRHLWLLFLVIFTSTFFPGCSAEDPDTPPPTRNPTRVPTRNPTRVPTRNPTRNPTRAPTREPTREPTLNPTRNPTVSPTANPTGEPTLKPTAVPTAQPTNQPTASPTKQPVTIVPTISFNPTLTPYPTDVVIKDVTTAFVVLVSEQTTRASVEEAFVATANATLTGSSERRKLWERMLEPEDTGLPEGCVFTNQGASDSLCSVVSNGTFSYSCGTNKYACCETAQGQQIDTGEVAGNCTRNDISDYPVYDPSVVSIDATASRSGCNRYGLEPQQGSKCLLVLLTLSGPNEAELLVFQQTIDESAEDGTFNEGVNEFGFPAVVLQIPETASPTVTPPTASPSAVPTDTPTATPTTPSPTVAPGNDTPSPTVSPTVKPTVSPTRSNLAGGEDPCPKLTGDCEGCVTNPACLWCPGKAVCFNTDPDKRETPTSEAGVSRFLEEVVDECIDLASNSLDVCDTAAPTGSPTLPPVPTAPPVPPPLSGGSSNWRNWNVSILFAIISGVVLYLE